MKTSSLKIVVSTIILVFASFQVSCQKLYKTTRNQSGVIIGGALAMVGSSFIIEEQRGAFTAEDIALLNPQTILGVDQGTVDNFSDNARRRSDYFKDAIFIAPLTLFLSGQARENTKEIFVMYTEVFTLNGGITKLSKSAFGRYRPYAYNPNVDLELKLEATTRRSFFSGHVSHVASLSYFTATVFDDLYPDSDIKYIVWAGAITAPAITGYLRVKAGRHYSTDVIVGYGVGALVGYFIPQLHKITQDSDFSVIGAEGGLGLAYNF